MDLKWRYVVVKNVLIRISYKKIPILGLLVFFILGISSTFCSAEEISFFTGSDIDRHSQGFSYAGFDVTHSLSQTIGISGQVVPNYLTYKYVTGGQEIKAKASGISLLGGVKFYWEKSMIAFFGGGVLRDTHLNPDDPGSSNRGQTKSPIIQGECSTWLTNAINIWALANYSFRDDFIYEKFRIKSPIFNFTSNQPYTFYFGIEQFLGKNTDYQGEGAGAVLEFFHSVKKFSISVKGGYKHDSNFGKGIYYGLDMYKGF
jgi:hypothetical protein